MDNKIQVTNMLELDIVEAENIWVDQYDIHCNEDRLPDYWKEQRELFRRFLKVKINNKNAIVANIENKMIGFLAYDEFPFNGENTLHQCCYL